jgi:chromate transport protein ChrA
MKKRNKTSWDTVGIILSILCIIHCVALPIIILLLPAIATAFIPDECWVHNILFFLIITVAVLAFVPGYRFHRRTKPLCWLACGVSILFFATFFAHDLGHHFEPILAIVGSLCIITAHYLNHKSCKHCEKHQHSIKQLCD